MTKKPKKDKPRNPMENKPRNPIEDRLPSSVVAALGHAQIEGVQDQWTWDNVLQLLDAYTPKDEREQTEAENKAKEKILGTLYGVADCNTKDSDDFSIPSEITAHMSNNGGPFETLERYLWEKYCPHGAPYPFYKPYLTITRSPAYQEAYRFTAQRAIAAREEAGERISTEEKARIFRSPPLWKYGDRKLYKLTDERIALFEAGKEFPGPGAVAVEKAPPPMTPAPEGVVPPSFQQGSGGKGGSI